MGKDGNAFIINAYSTKIDNIIRKTNFFIKKITSQVNSKIEQKHALPY